MPLGRIYLYSIHLRNATESSGEIQTTESILSINMRVLVVGMAKYKRDRPILIKPDFTVKQTTFQIYRENAIELEKSIRMAIRVSFIFLVLSSTFGLPLFILDMIDPAIIVYDLTKDL